MIVKQIYTKCLAEASYYIESKGKAVIIDPLREPDQYLELLEKSGAELLYILETHFHADFVSGHVDLANLTGAKIIYGPGAETNYDTHNAQDGEQIIIGDISMEVLHTPGHTPESSCYLLRDENGLEHSLFTGDTLFIGDVGRPDLAIDNGVSKEDLAKQLYHSLRNKIMTLPDHITIYPAHGAGSACGKNMSKETYDSLGSQKLTNYALRPDMSEQEFVEEVLNGMPPPPAYFALNAMLNKVGYESMQEVLSGGLQAMKPAAFSELLEQDEIICIDTRHQDHYKEAHVPGSIFFGLNGGFAPWVATVLKDVSQRIIFIADPGKEREVILRLARVGFDQVEGYLEGGVEAWKLAGNKVGHISTIEPIKLGSVNSDEYIIDVRKPGEHAAQHMAGVPNYPLDYADENISLLDPDKKYIVHCAGGYRSVIYASLLKAKGMENITDVKGGFGAMKKIESLNLTAAAVCTNS